MTVLLVIAIVGIWWKVSAHKYFTGQSRNIDIEKALGFQRIRPPGTA